MDTFRVLSWDVGIANLAYCVLEEQKSKKNTQIKILDWSGIDLIEDNRVDLQCCGKLKSGKDCGKKAKFCIEDMVGKFHGYCGAHKSQSLDITENQDLDDLFDEIEGDDVCVFQKKNGECCGKKAKYCHFDDSTYCTAHHKSAFKKLTQRYAIQRIKKVTTTNFSTAELQVKLITKLDALLPKFAELKIMDVIIENQPVYKNPRMKAIASTLFDYFLIRSYIDKSFDWNIRIVKYIAACNKLKVDKDNTVKVLKTAKEKKKYAATKGLGIIYTRRLIKQEDDLRHLKYLDKFAKKDDLCDCYLQGRYYMQFQHRSNNPSIEQAKNNKPKAAIPGKHYKHTGKSASQIKHLNKTKASKPKAKTKSKSKGKSGETHAARNRKIIKTIKL